MWPADSVAIVEMLVTQWQARAFSIPSAMRIFGAVQARAKDTPPRIGRERTTEFFDSYPDTTGLFYEQGFHYGNATNVHDGEQSTPQVETFHADQLRQVDAQIESLENREPTNTDRPNTPIISGED